MATTYTSDSLRNLFQSSFNLSDWYSFLLNFFHAGELKQIPERILGGNAEDEGYYLGNIDTTDYFRIGLFHYRIRQGSVANKRVELRNLVKPFLRYEFDAALVVFDSSDHWRFSFISDIKGEATSPKRYTYVFGNHKLLYKTPIERFHYLQKKGISFENLKAAFSVEALSDEFFNKYREQYADFIQYVTGKRFVKVGSKWEEKKLSNPNPALMQAFGHDEKKIRDYIKKMMGRITFLHFLQRKGWMCGDLNYMQNLFERSWYKNDYLDSVLEPLFFGILNTKPAEREALFVDYGWDKDLLEEWKDIPYLNGGLFERDEEDEPESVFPAEYFQRLFQFFSEYNFTIDENDPNDAEIGVDPEMLGKIFENLLEDNKDKGAFYTPKEIVRYMCQESLIAYLDTNTSVANEKIRKFVLSPEEGVQDIPENKKAKLLSALEEVKICDPAIGSGAFPMGLLNELLHCREVLSGEHYDRAEIKKSILQNNIYGVDIDKGAIDIARLRFWLSIVVDEDTPSPLPNLDYKIMQGNSLIESFQGVDLSELTYKRESKKDRGEVMLFDDEKNRLQKTVSQLLTSYYSCSEHEKKLRLRKQISDAINQQLEAQFVNSSILTKLKDIDLAGNNQFFLWHTWFSDVFNREDGKSGFDIVIGNPPYVFARNSKDKGFTKEDKKYYYDNFQLAKYQVNLYHLFVEQGVRFLSNEGIFAYIIPNNWLTINTNKVLREYVLGMSNIQVVNFYKKVFETADVDSSILIFSKSDKHQQIDLYEAQTKTHIKLIKQTECATFLKGKDYVINIDLFKNGIIPLILEKIESQSFELKEIALVKAGLQAYEVGKGTPICTKEMKDNRVYHSKEKLDDTYFRYLQGVDVCRYKLNWSGEYLKYGNNLAAPRKFKLFSEPRILVRQIPSKTPYCINACFVNETILNDRNSMNILDMKKSPLFLLGLLNSKLMSFWFIHKFGKMQRGIFPQFKINELEIFPIVNTDVDNEMILENLVQTGIKGKDYMDDKIDEFIYKLYNLTEDEIKVIGQHLS